jgi:hypothetical protein
MAKTGRSDARGAAKSEREFYRAEAARRKKLKRETEKHDGKIIKSDRTREGTDSKP